MKTYEEFKVMSLRPAIHNGAVFEVDVDFDDAPIFRIDIDFSRAIGTPMGDSVKIRGKVFAEEEDYEYINIYMYGDAFTDFINKYGVNHITANVRMKLEQVYTIYEAREDYCYEPKKVEIVAYKLVEIIEV